MKFTIHGFSQQRALEFRKEIEKRGKITVLKLDCTDLMLLRWFVDFYPRMIKKNIRGQEYAWVNYETIVEDLPLLDLEKLAVYRRFKKLAEFGILKHKHVKDGGSYSFYGFGANYQMLIDTSANGYDCMSQNTEGCDSKVLGGRTQKSEGYVSKDRGGMSQKIEGVCLKRSTKDSSINNSSIKETNKENIKRKETTSVSSTRQYQEEFEILWSKYPNKKGKDNALNAYIKARKDGTSYEEVEKGISNYLLEIKAKETQKNYIKHGSTWFRNKCWLDDYDTETNTINQPTVKPKYAGCKFGIDL